MLIIIVILFLSLVLVLLLLLSSLLLLCARPCWCRVACARTRHPQLFARNQSVIDWLAGWLDGWVAARWLGGWVAGWLARAVLARWHSRIKGHWRSAGVSI